VEGLGQFLEVHPTDDVADRLGAHGRVEDAATTAARPVPFVQGAEVVLGQGHERLDRFDLVALLADVVLGAVGVAAIGAVADPAGAWGVAIIEADSSREVEALQARDPVVLAGRGFSYQNFFMPTVALRPVEPRAAVSTVSP